MLDIIVRAGCFVAIIIMGFLLRKVGVFKPQDFHVLSKIVIKITLPASIIFSFSGKDMDPSLLVLTLMGLGAGILYITIAWLLNAKASKEQRAFEILNSAGYNIGNFTMPFVQSFLGPMGVIATSLFDTGNACISLGGALAAASMAKNNQGLSLKPLVKTLVRSLTFDCYIVMTILALLHISLPAPVISLAEIIANANAFVAMLMLGVGFELSGNRTQVHQILRILVVRYGVAVILALVFYHLLPFDLEIRKALMILAFSPIPAAAPAFTGELKGDVGLASAVNSISIIISIFCIVGILLITL